MQNNALAYLRLAALLGATSWVGMACGQGPGLAPDVINYVNSPPPPQTSPSSDGNLTQPGAKVLHFRPLPVISATDPNLCLDVAGTVNGSRVQAAPCTGLPNQEWVLRDGQLMVYENKCLDLPPDATATNAPYAVVNDCNSTVPNQIWADYNNTMRIVGSVQCLTVTSMPTSTGVSVILGPCQDSDNTDLWTLGKAGKFNITPFDDPNQCIGTVDNSTAAGSPLVIAACTGKAGQKWSMKSNFYTLNGQCLDAPSLVSGTQLQINPCTGSASQIWFWQNLLRLQTGNKCLDMSNGKLVLNECLFTNSQRLYLTGSN